MEGCGFRDLQEQYNNKNAAILGVSFDSAADNKAFAEKFSFGYPLLCDTNRAMGLAYGAADEPGTGGYAQRIGIIIGPDGTLLEVSSTIDCAEFPQQALDAIP